MATGGLFGADPVDAVIGSYGEQYEIVGYNRLTGVEVVNFSVTNTTGWESFFRILGDFPGTNTSDWMGASIKTAFNWRAEIHVPLPHGTSGGGGGSASEYDGGYSSGGDSGGGGSSADDGVYTGGGVVNNGVY